VQRVVGEREPFEDEFEVRHLRITAGFLKGRKLAFSPGTDLRPTSSLHVGILFDLIGDEILESRFLDLFAGSGRVGLEALSRGAERVVFVEKDRDLYCKLNRLCSELNLGNSVEVFRGDVYRAIKRFHSSNLLFDFIFLDPPYAYECDWAHLMLGAILKNGGRIFYEHSPDRKSLDRIPGGLHRVDNRVRGDTAFSVYRKKPCQR
jgi:16S rRNA (guanine(966)-N(2))-methyltransferase RsmD